MSRLAAILLATSVAASAGMASAEEHHKAWWNYLKGEWSFEITPMNVTGTVTWSMAAKGNALIGRFVDSDGSIGNEISGWRSDTKMTVVTGFGSQKDYWQIDFNKLTADTSEGLNYGVLPDGRSYKGTFKGKKVDENHYEWQFKGKTGDGEELSMTGKYTRKAE